MAKTKPRSRETQKKTALINSLGVIFTCYALLITQKKISRRKKFLKRDRTGVMKQQRYRLRLQHLRVEVDSSRALIRNTKRYTQGIRESARVTKWPT